jgi:hypothetical protein
MENHRLELVEGEQECVASLFILQLVERLAQRSAQIGCLQGPSSSRACINLLICSSQGSGRYWKPWKHLSTESAGWQRWRQGMFYEATRDLFPYP